MEIVDNIEQLAEEVGLSPEDCENLQHALRVGFEVGDGVDDGLGSGSV